MKKVVLLCMIVFGFSFFIACEDEEEQQETQKVSITQGIYGTVLERYGDWMPGLDSDHGERPISIGIYVYEYTKVSDFESLYYGYYPTDKMPKPLVAKTFSKSNGFYEISLAPGTYSIFLLEDGKMKADGLDGYGGVNPVTIDSGEIIKRDITLNHAVY